eukprot:2221961-Rhodomonas_salina.1
MPNLYCIAAFYSDILVPWLKHVVLAPQSDHSSYLAEPHHQHAAGGRSGGRAVLEGGGARSSGAC